MAWDKVHSGQLDDGRRYDIERQVFQFLLPGAANSHLPIRRNAYRLRLEQPDGTFAVVGHARAKQPLIDALPD